MKRYIKIIIICSITLVAVGCGKQHKAESAVKDFLDQNMTAADYSISFNKIDSTKNLTDSMIIVMKNSAKKNRLFKKNIEYGMVISHIYLQRLKYVMAKIPCLIHSILITH